MSIANDLNDVVEASGDMLARLAIFADHIPDEWITAAAALSEKATIRRRRLPSDMVLWLVVGMAFFRNEPISEVARRLNICAEGLANDALLADSALSQARQRLGKQPLEWLFKQCADVWGRERYPEDHWHVLQVFAIDGALFRTQDMPELRAHFGSGNTSTNRQTPYPMLRLVTLMNVRSHVIANAAISPYRKGEIPLASEFIHSLPDKAVTLLDKGFFGADLLLRIQAEDTDRHWIIPERKGLPVARFSAAQVATLYHERWEIELGYRDIKSAMQHNAITLRSKKVDLVYQELWGLLLGYNLVRREASQAAVAHQRAPNEVSFKFTCQFIANQMAVMAGALSPAHTPRRLAELRGCIGVMFIEKRPRPSRPRAVKISKTRFPVNRNAAPLK